MNTEHTHNRHRDVHPEMVTTHGACAGPLSADSLGADTGSAAGAQAWAHMEAKQGDTSVVRGLLRCGLKASPRSRYVHLAWAQWERLQGSPDTARFLLKRGCSLNPTDPALAVVRSGPGLSIPPCIHPSVGQSINQTTRFQHCAGCVQGSATGQGQPSIGSHGETASSRSWALACEPLESSLNPTHPPLAVVRSGPCLAATGKLPPPHRPRAGCGVPWAGKGLACKPLESRKPVLRLGWHGQACATVAVRALGLQAVTIWVRLISLAGPALAVVLSGSAWPGTLLEV